VTLNIMTKHTVVCMLAITWLLTACSSLTQSDKPVVTTWWLEPYTDVAQVTDDQSLIPVRVSVSTIPGLDSKQILNLSHDAALKPYAGARWTDHPPELLRSLIGRSIEFSGRLTETAGNRNRGGGSCDLNLELREFFADLDAGGRTTGVRVALVGSYQCDDDEIIAIDSQVFVPVAVERMSVIVAAFQDAIDQVAREILQQIH
jgi:cholesterol transport system auxiliary component